MKTSSESPFGVYLIKGPKKSGKSTFARTLLNHLLTRYVSFAEQFTILTLIHSYQRVAFLECDVGQSEFTPGGMVALNVISKPLFGMLRTIPNSSFH